MGVVDHADLRSKFNEAASDYQAVRPGYPEQVFEDIIALSGIPPGGRALEVGCGTGQATLPFARRGYAIHCLDLGADMLALAAQNLRSYPQVHFEQCLFEDWPGEAGEFDLVYAATSFHWIPREVGYPKAARLLKPGGALAVFSNLHPSPFTGFFLDVQAVYRKFLPDRQAALKRPDTAVEIAEQADFIRSLGLFAALEVRTYAWSQTYSAADYIRLLNTYSHQRAMDEGCRSALFEEISRLIERSYGGSIERPYLTVLYLGKKEK